MRRILLWLFAVLFLAGCGNGTKIPGSTTAETTAVPENSGAYASDGRLEAQTDGAVVAFPLDTTKCSGIEWMGEDLLFFFTEENGTVLQLLDGKTLQEKCRVKRNSQIFPEAPDVRVAEQGIGYYDRDANAVVFLDTQLEETRRMQVPDTVLETPVLAQDWSTIYFCTGNSIRGLDLRTGNPRLIRGGDHYQWQTLNQLYRDDTVLQFTAGLTDTEMETCYISVENGQTLFTGNQVDELSASGDWYFAHILDGNWSDYVFGKVGSNPRVLKLPGDAVWTYPVLERGGVLLVSSGDTESQVCFFDLEREQVLASVKLEGVTGIWDYAVDDSGSYIWLLDYDLEENTQTLYRWDMTQGADDTFKIETGPYYTADNPDIQGLEQFEKLAQELGNCYGVDLSIWNAVKAPEPTDYRYTAEHRVDAIEQGLRDLEQALAVYPQGFLEHAASKTAGGVIHISLVRDITGEKNQMDANGIQFWTSEGEAYIGLEVGEQIAGALFHEIFHIMDSYVLSSCVAYDDWNTLNPQDFEYDYDDLSNQNQVERSYLDGEDRAFVDIYSMSYPKEDRARIMEYAMLPNAQEVFSSAWMQKKLTVLCQGIRKAFDLEQSPELPWEQYLEESLAP